MFKKPLATVLNIEISWLRPISHGCRIKLFQVNVTCP